MRAIMLVSQKGSQMDSKYHIEKDESASRSTGERSEHRNLTLKERADRMLAAAIRNINYHSTHEDQNDHQAEQKPIETKPAK